MSRALVLSLQAWNFADEKTGEMVSGAKILYTEGDTEQTQRRRGLVCMDLSVPSEVLPQFTKLPGVYELSLSVRPGQRNRPVLRLISADFVAAFDIDLFSDIAPGLLPSQSIALNGSEKVASK